MSVVRLFIGSGAICGFLSVALGAFAAHGLKESFDDYSMKVFQTGVQYQFYHSFALILCGILAFKMDHPLLRYAGFAFLIGIFIFSGSLYLLAFTKLKWWGAVTPLGGVSFLIGWAILAVTAFKIGD